MPIASIPRYYPVVPSNIPASLLIRDELVEQRQSASRVLDDCFDIYKQYYSTGKHPLVTSETARWGLAHNDHTSLSPKDEESTDYMRRMAIRSAGPVASMGMCARKHKMKLALDLEILQDNPNVRVAVVSGAFPHWFPTPDQVWKDMEEIAELFHALPNPKDVDSVIPYLPHMQGDREFVEKILRAEGEAAKQFGLRWKSILKISAQAHSGHNKAYGRDYFKSVYESTLLALEAGADCAKTSSGLGAKPPLHDLVTKDDGAHIQKSIPMLYAIRDFNAQHKNDPDFVPRFPKFSGGNENEADVAVLKYAVTNICGAGVADMMVMGAGPRFRDRLTEYIYLEEGPKSGAKPEDFSAFEMDFNELPAGLKGLPKSPKGEDESVPVPPELAAIIEKRRSQLAHDGADEMGLQI